MPAPAPLTANTHSLAGEIMRTLSKNTLSWISPILGLLMLFGCGGGSTDGTVGYRTSINLNGGDANPAVLNSIGGDGALNALITSADILTLPSTLSSAVTVPPPNVIIDYGDLQYIVSGNETIELNDDSTTTGRLYVLPGDTSGSLYLGNGNGPGDDPVVTGLFVPQGTTLTLQDNFTNEFYTVLNDDIVIDGELITANVSSSISLDSFNGNLIIGSTGVISTQGNGGDITLYADLTFVNQGIIDASGVDGGKGLRIDITANGDLFNSGSMHADGGNTLTGSAGAGGTVFLYSEDGNLYNSGVLTANGGNATNGTGGLSGDIYLETFGLTPATPRDLVVRGTLQANGGDAINGDGGSAGFPVSLQNNSEANTSFGSRILVNADLNSRGGASTGAIYYGGNGFEVNVSSFDGSIMMTGNIDLSGGDGNLRGGNSGWFYADTFGFESIELAYDVIALNGGIGDFGGNGGYFDAQSLAPGIPIVSDTDIYADGGDGGDFGGDGGTISLDSNGVESIPYGILSADAGFGTFLGSPGFIFL
jgi:hypothetical protein